jgi:hypothetical protein
MNRPFSGYWVGDRFYDPKHYFVEVSPAGSLPVVGLEGLNADQEMLLQQGNYMIFEANGVTLAVPAEKVMLTFGEPRSSYDH